MKRYIYYSLVFFWISLVVSCSNSDYLNAVPGNSIGVVSMDMGKMNGFNNQALLKALLHVTNMNKTGIDISCPVILFESADGNLGVCAKVDNKGNLEQTLDDLVAKGACQALKEYKDCQFTLLNHTWVVGFTDDKLLVMGPITASDYSNVRNRMAKYLYQAEEKGIKASRIYEKLDSIDAPMKMVVRVDALPEKMILPFTLGAPIDTEPSQLFISAKMKVEDNCLVIDGKTFSFSQRIDKALRQATQTYGFLDVNTMFTTPKHGVSGLYLNVKGEEFMKLINGNRGFQALLAGFNAAIDMDNILKSVNGDMCVTMSSGSGNDVRMSMCAQLEHCNWLKDVDYWKQSCPSGGQIRDWDKNAYCYTDGHTSFYFGVTPDLKFYSGGSENDARLALTQSKDTVSQSMKDLIDGQRFVMMMNVEALMGENKEAGGLSTWLKPLFGDINSVVYRLDE